MLKLPSNQVLYFIPVDMGVLILNIEACHKNNVTLRTSKATMFTSKDAGHRYAHRKTVQLVFKSS